MSESTYTIDGTRVKGEGWSYQLTNTKDAERLCQTLNTYHATSIRNHETEYKLDKLQKTIISLQMSISIIGDELERLHKEIL